MHSFVLFQVTELSETTRGSGGFGSTGVAHSTLGNSAVPNDAKRPKVRNFPVPIEPGDVYAFLVATIHSTSMLHTRNIFYLPYYGII